MAVNGFRIRYFKFGATILGVLTAMAGCSRNQSDEAPPAQLAPQSAETITSIAAAIDNPDRLPGDSDEDEWRKPRAVLEFMGIQPGMDVLDYFAAAGYFSELLARSVGPAGSVVVYNNPPYAQFAGEKLVKRLANGRLQNAKAISVPTGELKLDANSLDGVLFYLAYHDLYWKPKDAPAPFGNAAAVTAALFRALRPGGVVVVVDHAANPGGDTVAVADALHRIDPQVVKNDFAKAGFEFDDESAVLQNAEDDRNKEVTDEAVRHKTDRFVYKFRKPAR